MKKIKVYCVLFDTLPLIDKIVSLSNENNLQILRQIGSCWTVASCIQLLTGKMPSDLHNHGIGYMLEKKFKHLRHPVTKKIDWPWKKQILLYQLLKHNWKVRYHSDSLFPKYIFQDISIKISSGCNKHKKEYLVDIGSNGRKVMEKENKFICQSQIEKNIKNVFYLIRYEHYHQALYYYGKNKKKFTKYLKIGMKKSLELMNRFDFDEPNSIFWFFSDHGDWNLQQDIRYPDLDMYYSWALVKDNTKNPIKINSKFISIGDFFPTIMDKFNYNYKPFLNIDDKEITDTYSIEKEQDQNRIYYVEDARIKINKYISTTAMACKFVDWQNDKPRGILQVSYHSPDKKWKCFLTSLSEDGLFAIKPTKKNKMNDDLRQKVIKRFKWAK